MTLEMEIKTLIIESLDLEDIEASDITSDAPLFGDGLGLDSIDALELGLAIARKYKITINADNDSTHLHFSSVNNLVKFIESSAIDNDSDTITV